VAPGNILSVTDQYPSDNTEARPTDAVVDFEPDQTAVVLVEFQRQWTDSGLYNLLIRRSLECRNVVERTRETVEAAREAGVTVVHTPLLIDPDNKKGWLATLTRGLVFTEGTEKAEFTPGVYEEDDPVTEGRYTFDAFKGSDLATILDANDVRKVFFAGFTTDQCVAKSLKTALDCGYDAYVLTDLTATYSVFLQRRTERRFGDRAVTSSVITDESAPSRYSREATESS
jgi:nicotinamidase-related amidase